MNKHVIDKLFKQGIPSQVERMIEDEQEIQHVVELEQSGALPKNIKKQPQVIKDLNTIQQLSENYLNHQTLPENIERVETKDQYGNQRFLYIKKNAFDYFILETLEQKRHRIVTESTKKHLHEAHIVCLVILYVVIHH